MKPHKRPILFSVLVIFLLFTGSLTSLRGMDLWELLGLAGAASVAEGYAGGPMFIPVYLANLAYVNNLNNYVQSKSGAVGIAPESYAQALFDDWKLFSDSYEDIFTLLTTAGDKIFDLYFVRVAEYSALDYLAYESLPEEGMKHVVTDMRPLIFWMESRMNDLFDHLAADNEERLPEGYHFDISQSSSSASASGVEPIERDNIKFYYVLEEPATNETIIWDLELLRSVKIPGATKLELGKYFTTAPGHIQVEFYDKNYPGWFTGHYVILYGPNGKIDHKDFSTLTATLTDFLEVLRTIYLTARDYARVYHEWLRSNGYRAKGDVPSIATCPPPDVIPIDVVELENGAWVTKTADLSEAYLDYKQLAFMYDAFLANVAEGLTPTGEIKSCVALVAERLSEGNYTVTHTLTETITTTRTTVVNATTTTITTTINGTQTVITTTTGGTTVTETGTTTTTTTWIYKHGETKIPDTFTRFYNVTICVPKDDGTEDCFSVYEFVIIDSLCDVSFVKGQTTILSCPLKAMVDYGDGYIRFKVFPTGTKITPEKIIIHTANGDVETDRYDYREETIEYWLRVRGYYHPPTTVTQTVNNTLAAIGMLWSTLLVLFPMFIALIAVLAIPKILSDVTKTSRG